MAKISNRMKKIVKTVSSSGAVKSTETHRRKRAIKAGLKKLGKKK